MQHADVWRLDSSLFLVLQSSSFLGLIHHIHLVLVNTGDEHLQFQQPFTLPSSARTHIYLTKSRTIPPSATHQQLKTSCWMPEMRAQAFCTPVGLGYSVARKGSPSSIRFSRVACWKAAYPFQKVQTHISTLNIHAFWQVYCWA